MASRSTVTILFGVLWLTACGGGSGSGTSGPVPPPGGSTPSTPTTPPPASNQAPALVNPTATQQAVYLHPYRYDVAQGGKTFSDPYGTGLTYQITIGHAYAPTNDPTPPAGLRVEGTTIVGAPSEVTVAVVTVTATDQAAQSAQEQFNIIVNPNAAPTVVNANDGALVSVGSPFDYEATKAGTVFADANGDALSYQVSLRGSTAGVAVSGTHVTGSFSAAGLVEVTVTASDGYGGTGKDVFALSAPGPEPPRPVLPTTTYLYADSELPLPYIFQLSSQIAIPPWDS